MRHFPAIPTPIWLKFDSLALLLLLSLLGFLSFSAKASLEKAVLLEFKASISDPEGVLFDWVPLTDSGVPEHCSWNGVVCDNQFWVSSLKILGGNNHFLVGRQGKDKDLSCFNVSEFPFYGVGIRRNCSSKNGKLIGEIPSVIAKLKKLRVLSLPFHKFSGEIPSEIWGLEDLEVLDLEGNLLSGLLPVSFRGSKRLRVLNLGLNRIRGEIPGSLSELVGLELVNLAANELDGSIPVFVGRYRKLWGLYLSMNRLKGEIPDTWGSDCRNLKYLDLSGNALYGEIPRSLGECRELRALLLGSNMLNNVIPRELGLLKKLEVLDISRNMLGGHKRFTKTPSKVRKLINSRVLLELNPSSDESVPYSSVQSTAAEDLQTNGDSPSESENDDDNNHNKRLNTIEMSSIISASVIVLVLLALIVVFIYTKKCTPRDSSRIQVYERREIKVFTDIGVPLNFQHVVKATDCFSAGKCIGCGGFGATYKAEISPGIVVAVKRLAVGRFHCIQQFHAEIKTLGRIRHPNLVTLIGYHASEMEMFLIYNYLPGGNLEKFIQERSSKLIKWNVIHKIALDVARAIAYLHDECNPRVIHRDVKPSNILLDNDFNAYLSDFGLSRLLENSETHATTGVAGTFGYLAPEYAMTCRVSEKADVYSYGVVLLELISDKKALDPSFSSHGNGFNIVTWAHMLLRQGRAKEVFTAAIWESGPHDDLVEVLHLAVKCTVDSLTVRPTMKQAVQLLKQIRPIKLAST